MQHSRLSETDSRVSSVLAAIANISDQRDKVGVGKRPSFLSRHHASIIISSSKLGSGVFLSCMVKLGPHIIVFHAS